MTKSPQVSWKHWAIASVFVVLAFPQTGFAELPHPCANPAQIQAHEKLREEMLKKAGLSPQQIQQVKAIRANARVQADGLKKRLEAQHHELWTYLRSSNPNEQAALAIEGRADEIENQLRHRRLRTWFEMRQVMSTEQMNTYMDLRSQTKDSCTDSFSVFNFRK